MYLFVNEGDKVYEGSAAIPDKRACCGYDAWENTVYKADAVWNADAEQTEVGLVLEPLKSRIFIFDEKEHVEELLKQEKRPVIASGEPIKLTETWKRSICQKYRVSELWGEKKKSHCRIFCTRKNRIFSGFVRYENRFEAKAGGRYAAGDQ